LNSDLVHSTIECGLAKLAHILALRQFVADREPRDGSILVREWLDYATQRVPSMQIDKMKAARGAGLDLSFKEEERGLPLERRSGQQPRVFYRRELEANPLVIAKPAATP
jgi:hypothetical protein